MTARERVDVCFFAVEVEVPGANPGLPAKLMYASKRECGGSRSQRRGSWELVDWVHREGKWDSVAEAKKAARSFLTSVYAYKRNILIARVVKVQQIQRITVEATVVNKTANVVDLVAGQSHGLDVTSTTQGSW